MKNFNFNNLIRKYSENITAYIPCGGTYDDYGDFISTPAQEFSFSGAVISKRESKLFKNEGAYSLEDKVLYMTYPLPESLFGAVIKQGLRYYRIESILDNGKFTGVYCYSLKFVSTLNKKETGEQDD